MVDGSDGRPTPALPPSESRLDSWKEIANYLGRGVRTVQRWEREEGLPVHRLAHEKRGTVYAIREELAAWWDSRRLTLAATPASDEADVPAAPRLERVTRTTAMTSWPALSSDARLIAYVSDTADGLTPQIWIQQISGAALRLTDRAVAYSHLSFSPDDTRVIFTTSDGSGSNIYDVPTLGGSPRLLHSGVSGGRISPDRRSLACMPNTGPGIVIAALPGGGVRTIATELADVSCVIWLPNSQSVLAYARSNPALDADWWLVPLDGGALRDTGLVARLLREKNLFTMGTGAVWAGDGLIFSAAGAEGVHVYRQRLEPSTMVAVGAPERLTTGSESGWFPTAAAGKVAFVSSQADANLWSLAINGATGIARDPLRRMTRGPGILGFVTATTDFQTLAYFSVRFGEGDIFLRDLRTGSERHVSEGPAGPKWYPAISPSGRLLAYGGRLPGGARALRPIFIITLADGTWRKLGDDCGGRPREWVDERQLLIERFARLNSIALIDTGTAEQRDLVASADQSVRNPRLSPDRRWIAFDAFRPGESPTVYVAPFAMQPIPETAWLSVDRAASHPFWSADGRLLYYTPTGTNPLVRSAIRARPIAASGPADEPFAAYSSADMLMPAYFAGTAPLATPDQIVLVLGDFRGDVWIRDLG
jgi:Tol biopolymer transport system component